MNYDYNTPNGQNIGAFQTRIYDVNRPRKVKDDFTLQMARDAINNYKKIKESVLIEIRKYEEDSNKCHSLLERLNLISTNTGNLTSNILESQTSLKNNFYLTDGTVPGIKYSIEAAKQISEFLDAQNALTNEVNKQIGIIENSIQVLKNNCLNDIENKVQELENQIRNYYNQKK